LLIFYHGNLVQSSSPFCGRELYGIGRIGCYYFLLRCYAGRPIAKSFTRPCSSAFLGYNGFNRLL